MRKSKIMLVILLLVILGVEGYFYLFKKEDKVVGNNNNNLVSPLENINKEDEKYLVDITTPYESNALEYKEVKDGNITYFTISGLKNKELEDKINNEIKEKIYKIKNENKNDFELKFNVEIQGSYANVLSLAFIAQREDFFKDSEEYGYYYTYNSRLIDVLNVDLNTGDNIEINDVVIDKNILRTELVNNATENINRNIGFVCGGGPCKNPDPDYGKVEDGVLSIVNQYNKGNYLFTISEKEINLYFNNVYIPDPEEFYEGDEGYEKCKAYPEVIGDEEYKRYICLDNYLTYYSSIVKFIDITDTLIIYDKFKSEDNLYTKEPEKINRKFVKSNISNSWNMYEYMEETDNSLIDYNLDKLLYDEETDKLLDDLKNKVVKESSELKKDKFNIYNINGCIDTIANDKYYYVYFEVAHYSLDKDKYLENKNQIYLDKFYKMNARSMENELTYKAEYDYLKNYFTKKSYYFYIVDKNGKEYNTRDILNKNNIEKYIPDEWLSLGKYKNRTDMINSTFLMTNELAEFPDRLVIYDNYDKLILKYKGRSVELGTDYFERANIRKSMYK